MVSSNFQATSVFRNILSDLKTFFFENRSFIVNTGPATLKEGRRSHLVRSKAAISGAPCLPAQDLFLSSKQLFGKGVRDPFNESCSRVAERVRKLDKKQVLVRGGSTVRPEGCVRASRTCAGDFSRRREI